MRAGQRRWVAEGWGWARGGGGGEAGPGGEGRGEEGRGGGARTRGRDGLLVDRGVDGRVGGGLELRDHAPGHLGRARVVHQLHVATEGAHCGEGALVLLAHLGAGKDELERRDGARVARADVAVAVLVDHQPPAVGEEDVVRSRLAVLHGLPDDDTAEPAVADEALDAVAHVEAQGLRVDELGRAVPQQLVPLRDDVDLERREEVLRRAALLGHVLVHDVDLGDRGDDALDGGERDDGGHRGGDVDGG